uniref:Uncharacterized protein n=1 Tax=Anopheles funestus TaxID=62324 RepID=A0A182S0Z3_ANOFN
MRFLTKIFLFAFIALLGVVSAKPPPEDIAAYERLCVKLGREKDCWITATPPTWTTTS